MPAARSRPRRRLRLTRHDAEVAGQLGRHARLGLHGRASRQVGKLVLAEPGFLDASTMDAIQALRRPGWRVVGASLRPGSASGSSAPGDAMRVTTPSCSRSAAAKGVTRAVRQPPAALQALAPATPPSRQPWLRPRRPPGPARSTSRRGVDACGPTLFLTGACSTADRRLPRTGALQTPDPGRGAQGGTLHVQRPT